MDLRLDRLDRLDRLVCFRPLLAITMDRIWTEASGARVDQLVHERSPLSPPIAIAKLSRH